MLKLGIIGAPRVGKTTVFNAVAGAHADPDAYQARDEVRRAMVKVPDRRLDHLFDLFKPPKKVHAEIEYFDFPPLGEDGGEAVQLPPAVRETDALIAVLRAFGENPDPAAQLKRLGDEMILADLAVLEKRHERLKKEIDSGRDDNRLEFEALQRCRAALESEQPLRTIELTPADEHLLRGYGFLSRRPLLALVNAPDDGLPDSEAAWSQRLDPGPRTLVKILRGKLEAELTTLDAPDRAAFMTDYDLKVSALDSMIAASYDLLGLITYFTGSSEKDVRAWTVRRGAAAPEAAGVIHSDFEKGFIRAEVFALEDLLRCGSTAQARKEGLARLEGKEYTVNDGDYILFRFNV